MWQIFVSIALLFGVLCLILDTKKPSYFPPGPGWVPIVGSYFEFRRLYKKFGYTHLVWTELAGKHGDLLGLKMGRDRVVVASGFSTVRQVLTSPHFDARPDGFFFRLRSFGQRFGIVFVDGDFFNEQKKFCMKHLRSFGLNRSIMEDRVALETDELVYILRNKEGEPVLMPDMLRASVINSLWGIVAGQRFSMREKRQTELLQLINACFRLQDMTGGILNQMPFLRFVAPETSSYNKLVSILKVLSDFFQELIEDHRKTASTDDQRDLIDAYLQELEMMRDKENSTFSEEQLNVLLLDLFLAGAETTASTLGFAILYLIHYPEIQKKLREEIDSVVGSRHPEIRDKANLKYMEAFLMELQRHANVTPSTVAHRAKCDAEINGFIIPKDSIVMANLYSLHMDKYHWKNPEIFQPERFLDKDGNVINDDWLLPFGIGKRRCMGEVLARTSMFLFTSSLIFHFDILPVPEEPLPTLKGFDGATISPQPFNCIFKARR